MKQGSITIAAEGIAQMLGIVAGSELKNLTPGFFEAAIGARKLTLEQVQRLQRLSEDSLMVADVEGFGYDILRSDEIERGIKDLEDTQRDKWGEKLSQKFFVEADSEQLISALQSGSIKIDDVLAIIDFVKDSVDAIAVSNKLINYRHRQPEPVEIDSNGVHDILVECRSDKAARLQALSTGQEISGKVEHDIAGKFL